MSIARAASISYGGFSTGSGKQLHGPYSVDKDFDSITSTWVIVVTAATAAAFYSACDALETALNKRDQDLIISWPGGSWEYVFGESALNTSAGFSKGGDRETDTGRSRMYSVTFAAQLPATDENGMFAIQSSVAYEPSRVRSITMSGEVRAQNGTLAYDQYETIIPTWDTDIQAVVDSGAVWELQGEERSWDRTNHILSFTRMWVELIDQDAPGEDDNPEIVQQRMIFTRLSSYPGDSDPEVNRPERFVAEYSCYVDKDLKLGLDELSSLYEDSIFDWIKGRFVDEWGPQAFAVTEHSRQFTPTTNQISSRLIIMAYMEGGDVVESTRQETYRDARTIDYSPVWDEEELSSYADQQFLVRLREVTETKTRLGSHQAEPPLRPGNVQKSGWNVLNGVNSASPIHMGEPPDQVELTIVATVKIERFTKAPSGGGGDTVESSEPQWQGDEEDAARRIAEMTGRSGYTIPGQRLGTQ